MGRTLGSPRSQRLRLELELEQRCRWTAEQVHLARRPSLSPCPDTRSRGGARGDRIEGGVSNGEYKTAFVLRALQECRRHLVRSTHASQVASKQERHVGPPISASAGASAWLPRRRRRPLSRPRPSAVDSTQGSVRSLSGSGYTRDRTDRLSPHQPRTERRTGSTRSPTSRPMSDPQPPCLLLLLLLPDSL